MIALSVVFGLGIILALFGIFCLTEEDMSGMIFVVLGAILISMVVFLPWPAEKEGTNQHDINVADVCDSRTILENGNILVECEK